MPTDIRSYFTSGSSGKTHGNASTAKPKRRRVISSDDEDEAAQTSAKRTKTLKRVDKKSISSESEKEDVKEPKIMSPSNMFSKKPIKRQEAVRVTKNTAKLEAQVHDDEDFEASLVQLDTSDIEKKYLEDTKSEKKKKNQTAKASPEEKKKLGKTKDIDSHESEKKKKQSTSSNEDAQHEIRETSKSKKVKTPPKRKPESHKVEIEHKVQKKNVSPKEEVDVYEERAEKRKQHVAAYQQYLQRGGARNPGSKEVPTGAELCLAGLSFLITGVLDSLEREEAEELIKKYGGRILHQISKKTDYVIVGDEPGPSKMQKAKSFNIKQISEDELLELIRSRPAGKAADVKQTAKSKDKMKQSSIESDYSSPSPKKALKPLMEKATEEVKTKISPKKQSTNEAKKHVIKEEVISPKRSPVKKAPLIKTEVPSPTDQLKTSQKKSPIKTETTDVDENVEIEALVEKYRPKSMKQILGQQGDKSNARKLYNWLQNWQKNQSGQVKHSKPSPWAKNDDGAFFKAALLSGPPGIGKTTTVQVVCNELGFDLVEFNASDTRSKRLLKEEVSDLLSNTTLKDYFSVNSTKPSSKHVLLMDEVDGMAGNEDRGGLQELIALIKSSDIPIVCICNDRNNPKMRTLSNYTFDLRFQKPRLEQIRGAMRSICFKENINISTEDLDRLIESTNQDIRQVINHLALYGAKASRKIENEKKHINKDLRLGPWDVVKKVFSAEEHKHMSIHDKSDLFFHDYNIAALFVQENYLSAVPQCPRNEVLGRVAQAADSLALGDLVEKSIRSNNAWSLLPVQACYSSVIPGTLMAGHFNSQINFPSWLGRNSRTGKFDRLMQQVTVHTRLTTGASKEAINLDYIVHLRNRIVAPLVIEGNEGVDAAISIMNKYNLVREDLDAMTEISLWPGQRDPMQNVDSKVKAAFTRTYNKQSTAVPYGMATVSKKKASSQDEDLLEGEEENEINSEEDDDNVETDKMIKAKKAPAAKKTESKGKTTEKAPAKRGRGRGRGK